MDQDMRSLRDALGLFATGVTVVTGMSLPESSLMIDAVERAEMAREKNIGHQSEPTYGKGRAVGVTISSFNTVSLAPPLVLWSLARKSKNLSCFAPGLAHNVHVLADDQKDLALRFADSSADKFSSLDIHSSVAGIPLLPGCAAHFECRTEVWHAGGDHIIIVARVEHFVVTERAPLLFYRGQFKEIGAG